MGKFVNCSNHMSGTWSEKQRDAAELYGEIVDFPFPQVACDSSDDEINRIADETAERILQYRPAAVMCMGEFVVCFRIVEKLKAKGVKVLASVTERNAKEEIVRGGKVVKESLFEFQGFREY